MAVLGSLEAFSQRCFFCAVFFQKGRREVEKNALVWLGSIYYRSVHLSTVHQDYIPGDQWLRASFYYIGHISGKKDHDLEEIMVVEVVSP